MYFVKAILNFLGVGCFFLGGGGYSPQVSFAMLLMYWYAIHKPGFLAGLGIIRFNALGRYISVVVVQPSPVTGAPIEYIEQTGDIPICRKSKFKSHCGDFQLHTGRA